MSIHQLVRIACINSIELLPEVVIDGKTGKREDWHD